MTGGIRNDRKTRARRAIAIASAVAIAIAATLAQAVACSNNDDNAEASVELAMPSAAENPESTVHTQAAPSSPATSTCSTISPRAVTPPPFPTDPDTVAVPEGEGFAPDGGACPEPLIVSDGQCVSCKVAGARYRAAFTALEYGGEYASCTDEDDCVISGVGTNCSQSCGLVLAVDTIEPFTEATSAALERYCEDPDRTCLWPNVGCRVPGTPVCLDGFCTFTTCQ